MRYIILLLICFVPWVQAASIPQKQSIDSRITEVKYNPEDVVRVRTKFGISTLIQLEAGEHVLMAPNNSEGMGIGDVNAWTLSHVGNNIFLKPKAKEPNTNLMISTNKGRTYAFELIESNYPHFKVVMTYDKKITSDGRKNETPCLDGKNTNFNYDKWGESSIAPNYMWDDGRFTCLKFSAHAEIPVIYKVSPDKIESLVNFHFEEDIMVLHTVSNEYRLRLGNLVTGLKSDDVVYNGFNKKSTSISAKRELSR